MKDLSNQAIKLTLPSPIHKSERLSAALGASVWLKRDDLIPEYMGGNKSRKNVYIINEYLGKNNKPDVIITNGGASSNHARVVALLGAELGAQVHLVLHGVIPVEMNKNNYAFVATGAICHYVQPEQIALTIKHLAVQQPGKKVLVIPGGAHSKVGALAYEDAIAELDFEPDYIVHASGTGGTQAGLINGVIRRNWSTKVIGISVARSKGRGVEAIKNLIIPSMCDKNVHFYDQYTHGGYGLASEELIAFTKKIVATSGIYFDHTYTAKPMYGLFDLVRKNIITKNSRIVFWHTGSI